MKEDAVKYYKGFAKDMTCRGFQYKEGETYTTDEAKLCWSGFHACENPLDCFSYYSPNESVYREVELSDVSEEKSNDDTKVVAKQIKVGAELSVRDLCKAHFEFVKSKTVTGEQGKDKANLVGKDSSSLSAGYGSSLSAGYGSSLSAQDWSSLSAQDRSSLSARNWSSLSAQDRSSLSAQDRSSLSAQDRSSLSARNRSSLSAQDWSSLSAQDRSSLSARNWSSLSAGYGSSLSAGYGSSLSAGRDCVLAAFNSKAKAGIGSLIALAKREWRGERYEVVDFAAGIVDGENIKADTWYTVKGGKLVEVGE